MKLCIDIRWLHEALINAPSYAADDRALPIPGPSEAGTGNLGGVGRYLMELVPRLAARLTDAHCVLGTLAGRPVPALLEDLWPGAETIGLTAQWRPAGGAMGFLASLPALRADRATTAVLAPRSLDVFLSSQQLVVPSPGWARHHAVVCHDLAFIEHPRLFFPAGRIPPSYRAHYARLARAEHHVAVSERTASVLVERLGVPRSRITVTPEGVAPAFTPDGPRLAPGWPYALCVGSAGPGKNMPLALGGWVCARARRGFHLVMAGASSRRVAELTAGLAPEQAAAVHRAAPAGDGQLGMLYRGAAMLLIPSLVEGFGLPALEAMACGCPVVTASGTPMADMAGDAAAVVDPREADQLAEAILRVADDEMLRRTLIDRGLRVAAEYTWERTADLTAAVIRDLAARPGRGG